MSSSKVKSLLLEAALRLAVVQLRLSGKFNRKLYLKANRDVELSGEDPVRHFLLHGQLEGRNLCPGETDGVLEQSEAHQQINRLLFVRAYYRLLRLVNPHFAIEHWENYSIVKKSRLFDARYYLKNYPDVLRSGMDPVMHYVAYGYKEGRNPCASFDTVEYAIRHGIPSYSEVNPFVEYIRHFYPHEEFPERQHGMHLPDNSIPFDPAYYLKKYPDLSYSEIDAREHFLLHGFYEGRDSDPSYGGYSEWREKYLTHAGIFRKENYHSQLKGPVRISACLICEGVDENRWQGTLASLLIQKENLEIILVGNPADTGFCLKKMKNDFNTKDIRISQSVSELFQDSNDADGFICFLAVGDQLVPGALEVIKNAIYQHPEALLHYSDEEVVDTESLQIRPLFKCDFNPDFQREGDYIGNFLFVSRRLSGINSMSDFEPWSINRFLLVNQVLDQLERGTVNHVPQILYRRFGSSKWTRDQIKPVARLIERFARRESYPPASVVTTDDDRLRVKYKTPATDNKASIIIPTRNKIDLLRPCIESIQERTSFHNFELIIIDNGSDEPSATAYLDSLSDEYPNVTVIRHDHPFNYSELNNIGAKAATGQYLVFLNNDVEVIDQDWLEELLSQASRPEVGVVSPLLLYQDGTIQHAGVVLGVGGVAAHSFSGWDPNSAEFDAYRHARRVSAVTGACMAMRRKVFETLGGFDEANLPVDFNDIDLCLRAGEKGLHVLFTPHVSLYHHESKSRTSHRQDAKESERFSLEVAWMQERWFSSLYSDPYYNLNYSLGLPGFQLSWPPRENVAAFCRPEVPNLKLYVSHSNIHRANEVVKTMSKTPRTLQNPACETTTRDQGLSVIILNLDKPEFIVPLINSMQDAERYFRDRGFGFEILIGDTGSADPDVLAMYESAPAFVKVLYGLKYNFSRSNNQVFAELSSFDTVLFLNNDIEFCDNAAATLFKMLTFLNEAPEAGVVGAQLLFPDRTIQHAGIDVFKTGELKGFVYHPDVRKAACRANTFPRNMWAVTGACLMMKSSDFYSVNGFDEDYRTECQDAALCMEIRRRGLEVYVLAPGEILHFENGTREKGSEDWPDRQRFMRHWSSWIDMQSQELTQ